MTRFTCAELAADLLSTSIFGGYPFDGVGGYVITIGTHPRHEEEFVYFRNPLLKYLMVAQNIRGIGNKSLDHKGVDKW